MNLILKMDIKELGLQGVRGMNRAEDRASDGPFLAT
jgi:hypothetical protein